MHFTNKLWSDQCCILLNFYHSLAEKMQVSRGAMLIWNWSTRLSNCKFHEALQQQRGHRLILTWATTKYSYFVQHTIPKYFDRHHKNESELMLFSTCHSMKQNFRLFTLTGHFCFWNNLGFPPEFTSPWALIRTAHVSLSPWKRW